MGSIQKLGEFSFWEWEHRGEQSVRNALVVVGFVRPYIISITHPEPPHHLSTAPALSSLNQIPPVKSWPRSQYNSAHTRLIASLEIIYIFHAV